MKIYIGMAFITLGALTADSDRFIVPFMCLVIGGLLVMTSGKEIE